jgi:hypothetical protein
MKKILSFILAVMMIASMAVVAFAEDATTPTSVTLNTAAADYGTNLIAELKASGLSFNYVDINKYYLFNIYCPTQGESAIVKKHLDKYQAKYFVSESKTL